MPVIDLEHLKQNVPQGKQILGLDVGTKTIGIAISDKGWRLATGVETFRRTKLNKDLPQLLALMESRNIGGLVIGLPLNMDGSSGPRAQATRAFARSLLNARDLPLSFWDERLSTQAAERELIRHDMSRSRRAEIIDKQAAQYILQSALDRIAHCATGG